MSKPNLIWTTPSYATSKDTRGHPAFRSVGVRMFWRFYTWRLTQAGRWFIWPTFGFFTYSTGSLEYHTFVPLCYACAIWLVAVLCTFFFRPKVKLDVQHPDRVCAGEILPMDVEVTWLKGKYRDDLFLVPHRLPDEIDSIPSDGVEIPAPVLSRASPASQNSLSPRRSHARIELLCNKRGVYVLPSMRVETDFPFGLWRSWKLIPLARSILVYPQFYTLTRLELPMGRRYQPGGVALLSIVGDTVEYIGNREYRQGDNIRDIDWRATARLDHLIVREYREEYLLRVAVILDTYVPNAGKAKCDEADLENFERAVSLCASVSDYLARQEYVVDLFAVGPNLYHLTAGRSLAYLDQILDILACVKESGTEPFNQIEPELCENLSSISTVICVFMNWDQSRQSFVERLRQQGVAVRVVVVRDKPCTKKITNDNYVPVFSAVDFKHGIGEF